MKRLTLDLREIQNPGCCHCPPDERKRKLRSGDGLCPDVISELDEFPVRCVGNWAYDKIYFLTQYFGIFTLGMKNKFAGKLNYIEICAGPGRCILREDGNEIDGTSLAIVNHDNFEYVSAAVFIDRNETAVQTLNQRIEKLGSSGIANAVVGDYQDEDSIIASLNSIRKDGLNLVFVDPTDCSVPFNTIASIVRTLGRVDLIVNFPIGTDFNRNIRDTVLEPTRFSKAREKYSNFLGSDDFYKDPDIFTHVNNHDFQNLRNLFRSYYHLKLKEIGFEHFASRPVRHFYEVIYATANKRGIDFWRKAQTYGPNNQKSLDF